MIEMELRERFGQVARMLRKEQGATLREVAEQAGIARETLIAVEQGRANPTLRTMQAIARALHFESNLWRAFNVLD